MPNVEVEVPQSLISAINEAVETGIKPVKDKLDVLMVENAWLKSVIREAYEKMICLNFADAQWDLESALDETEKN